MPFTAQFRCIAGCPGAYPLDAVIYRCPTCGDLLEVVHDLDALRARSAAEWKDVFAARWRDPSTSGVWGKREWVHPGLRDESIVSLGEGATFLQRVDAYAAELGIGVVHV